MKLVWKILGGLVVFLFVALLVLSATGLEPTTTRPGLWIKGEPDTTPVNDWHFTDEYVTVMIQTKPWYGIPHSVMIFIFASAVSSAPPTMAPACPIRRPGGAV